MGMKVRKVASVMVGMIVGVVLQLDGQTLPGGGAGAPATTRAGRKEFPLEMLKARVPGYEEAKRLRPLKELEGNREGFLCVAISPNEKLVAAGGLGKAVYLWDLESGRAMQLEAHREIVKSVAFSKDSKQLVTVGEYEKSFVWNTETGDIEAALETARCSRFAGFLPDGTVLMAGHESWSIWDVRDERPNASVPVSTHINWMELSADGKEMLLGLQNGAVEVWDVEGRKRVAGKIRQTRMSMFNGRVVEARNDIDAVAFLSEERVLIGDRDQVSLWNRRTGGVEGVSMRDAFYRDFVVWPDGKMVLYFDESYGPGVKGMRVENPEKSSDGVTVYTDYGSVVAFSKSGKLMAMTGGTERRGDSISKEPRVVQIYSGEALMAHFRKDAHEAARSYHPMQQHGAHKPWEDLTADNDVQMPDVPTVQP
jgi:WD40 repeat protein